MPRLSPSAFVVVTVTYLTLVAGEVVPKHVALKDPEAIASRVARPLALVTKAAAPPVSFLSGSTDFIVRLMGLRPGFERPVTEEEIHDLIEEGPPDVKNNRGWSM
jgi:putative hemolysin